MMAISHRASWLGLESGQVEHAMMNAARRYAARPRKLTSKSGRDEGCKPWDRALVGYGQVEKGVFRQR